MRLHLPSKTKAEMITPIKTANAKLCNKIVMIATKTPNKYIVFRHFIDYSKTNPFKCTHRHHYHHSYQSSCNNSPHGAPNKIITRIAKAATF
jgi:hypothetical protein